MQEHVRKPDGCHAAVVGAFRPISVSQGERILELSMTAICGNRGPVTVADSKLTSHNGDQQQIYRNLEPDVTQDMAAMISAMCTDCPRNTEKAPDRPIYDDL